MNAMREYNINEKIFLRQENNQITIHVDNMPLNVLNNYRETIDYLKETLDADTFISKIAIMEKTGFLKDIERHGLDQEKILGAIGKMVACGFNSENYAENYSISDLELIGWFLKNIYSFKINDFTVVTLDYKIGYDQEEREDYLETHGEKYIEYLQRIYWIAVKYKNGSRYVRPVFTPEGSLKRAMNKLKEKVIEIRNKQDEWKEIKDHLEKCREKITKVSVKFSQEISDRNVKMALNHDWKDIFQIGCVFKIEDLWDFECLKHELKRLEASNYAISKKKNEKFYWQLREKESEWKLI